MACEQLEGMGAARREESAWGGKVVVMAMWEGGGAREGVACERERREFECERRGARVSDAFIP